MVKEISLAVPILILVGVTLGYYNLSSENKSRSDQNVLDDSGEPLILTPLIEQGLISEAQDNAAVTYQDFTDFEQNITSYSGYFTVDKTYNSNLFFWFFPSQSSLDDPVLLWLQGGPGSSSLVGLFTENGPFEIDENLTVNYREFSWTENHSVLYIDNPAGAGFSFTNGGYAQNETKVGEDLYEALVQFFAMFPELQGNDFFITGQSYGGHYIPVVSYIIYQNNQDPDSLTINLKGLAIGNPLIDARYQADYGSYFYNLGLIDAKTKSYVDLQHDKFIFAIEEENYDTATNKLFFIREKLLNISGLANAYNYQSVKLDDPSYWKEFIVQEKIRSAIHVGNVSWGGAKKIVKKNLYKDVTISAAPWIVESLSTYRVLLYNGQLDVIDPYPLMSNFIDKLEFTGKEDYNTAERKIWRVDGEVAGYSKEGGNLTEVLVRNAGHNVPNSQSKWAYHLIYKFVRNLPLYD